MSNAPYAGDCLGRPHIDPSKVMGIVGGDLSARGFQIQPLARDDAYCLTVTSPTWARCEVSIEDDGAVRWECKPAANRDSDPHLLTQLVLRMLAANYACSGNPEPSAPSGATLKSAVGRALDACGLDVRLAVCQDTACFEVEAQIVVANPERPERGQVRLSDNADMVWEWSCRDVLASSTDSVAKTIVRVLADATDLAKLH
jgi:hypothetical protein